HHEKDPPGSSFAPVHLFVGADCKPQQKNQNQIGKTMKALVRDLDSKGQLRHGHVSEDKDGGPIKQQ
ncbi:unnamed protein product, partial [marine sediment metagenome]